MINSSNARRPVAKLVNKHLDKRDEGCTKSNLKDNKKEMLEIQRFKRLYIRYMYYQDFRFQPHCSQNTVHYISDKISLVMSA